MLKGCILSEKEKKLFYVLKVSHLLWHPYEGLQIFICVVRVREVFELLFNLSIFCNISLGCVYTKRICKKLCFDLCVYVCVRLFFFGSEGLVLHRFGANSKSLLLREREGRGWKRNRLILSFFLLATQRRENRPQDPTHRMRNWLSTYLLNLKKNVGHCCNNKLHHSHIWRIFAIPCSLQQ